MCYVHAAFCNTMSINHHFWGNQSPGGSIADVDRSLTLKIDRPLNRLFLLYDIFITLIIIFLGVTTPLIMTVYSDYESNMVAKYKNEHLTIGLTCIVSP
jgi:hypothetical protein